MTTTTTTTTIETWLYAGLRLGTKDKPYHVWVDETGEELYYSKLIGYIPGQPYAVEVDRDADGKTRAGRPRYLAEQGDRHATDAQRERWAAEDKAAKQILESKRLEKAAAADTEIEQALETLRRHRNKLHSYAKKGAFTTYVIGELERPPRKETDDGDH